MMFQNNMILQREKHIPVWGSACPGETITVSIQGLEAAAAADDNGRWQVKIGPLHTSFRETMTITASAERIDLTNVQIGEVWLAAGQSNMEFQMRYDADLETEKEICTNENVRFFDYPKVVYREQIEEADYRKNFAQWRTADPENIEWFSAAGYYFAKEIQHKYQIPVGIIGCNWGGTPACAWMNEDFIRQGGGSVYLDEYRASLASLDPAAYEKAFRNDPASWKLDPFADPFNDLLMKGMGIAEVIKTLTGQEIDESMLDFSAAQPVLGPKTPQRPACLYDSMLSAVAPYGLRGILFYQGESDGDRHPEVYESLFPALISNYRSLWGEDLPFMFVQIAPFGHWMNCIGEPYVKIREAQQKASETIPLTGMAVISDIGMELDIHPKKKQPVGLRLALLAENKVYGEDVLCEAPSLVSVTEQDGTLILRFANSGTGLYLADHTPDGAKTDPGKIGGLELFIGEEKMNMDLVSAEAHEDTVILKGLQLPVREPVTVQLGCTGWYRINLYNSADLPARPAAVRCSNSI